MAHEADSVIAGYMGETPLIEANGVASPTSRLEPTSASGTASAGAAWMCLLGTGAPMPRPTRAGPASLLQLGDARILVDCGSPATHQLSTLGLRASEVTHIFITHHHFDHVADLAHLLLGPWITEHDDYRPPVIVGPRGTVTLLNRLYRAHEYDIRARVPHGLAPERLATSVLEIDDNTRVGGDGWTATAFRVDHLPVDEAFGYRFDTDSGSVAFSGDTRPNDNLVAHCRGVDVLVHEVISRDYGIPSYHTTSREVGVVASKADSKMLILNHFLPDDLPDVAWLDDVSRDFDGPVVVGHDLQRVPLGLA